MKETIWVENLPGNCCMFRRDKTWVFKMIKMFFPWRVNTVLKELE